MHLSRAELLPLLGAVAVLFIRYFGRYVVLPFASHLVGVWLWKRLVKTEHEAQLWLHHKHKITGQKVD